MKARQIDSKILLIIRDEKDLTLNIDREEYSVRFRTRIAAEEALAEVIKINDFDKAYEWLRR